MALIEIQNSRQLAFDEMQTIITNGEKEVRKLNEVEEKRVIELKATIEKCDNDIKVIEETDKKTVNNNKSNNNRSMNDKRFSFFRAINAVAGQKNFQDSELRYMEIGNKAFQNNGLAAEGQILLPLSTNRMYADMFGMGQTERRAVLAAASNAAVQTDVMDLLAPLYSKNPLLQAGSQVIYATSNMSFPTQSAITIDYVNGENGGAADKTPTNSTALQLAPKRIAGYVDISKTLLVQQNPANEAIIMNSIVNAINKAIITAALGKHSSVAYKPNGLYTGTGFTYACTSGASGEKIYKMISAVDTSDALEGSLGFMMHPELAYKLRQVPAFSTATTPILGDTSLAGYNYYTTTAMATGLNSDQYGIVFADWSKYIQAFFGSTPESLGALSILVDPYTQASANAVRLHINVYQDMGVLQSASFARGSLK